VCVCVQVAPCKCKFFNPGNDFTILHCIHLHVPVKGKGCLRSCGMLPISWIRYCVGACVQGIKTQVFAHPKGAGIAVCSPPSNHASETRTCVHVSLKLKIENFMFCLFETPAF
jgi:hypothetical protein